MAIIHKRSLFSWQDFQNDLQSLGDLERFKLVIDTMPDAKLIQTLRAFRGHGRNDYPIDALWNSLLAGIVFEHVSIESLRRELQRNAQLRELCGFDPLMGIHAVPSSSAYNRFLARLLAQEPLVRDMFDSMVKELMVLHPQFGTNLAGDGKAIHSFGKPSKKQNGDKRRDKDADWGVKTYAGVDQNGKAWEKIKSWFGFRIHLIAEADSELPVAYIVTKASLGEQPVMQSIRISIEEDRRIFTPVARSSYKWQSLYDKRGSIERVK